MKPLAFKAHFKTCVRLDVRLPPFSFAVDEVFGWTEVTGGRAAHLAKEDRGHGGNAKYCHRRSKMRGGSIKVAGSLRIGCKDHETIQLPQAVQCRQADCGVTCPQE